MKWIKAVLCLGLGLLLLFGLNHKFGDIPPLGKFLSPFTGFWQNSESKSFSAARALNVPGLKEQVTIKFDRDLIPHIFAGNNPDLYFAQGYITAQHRLWQMEFQTHVAAGRVSEIVGDKALELDRYQRRIGMVYGAQQSLASMMANPLTKEMLMAYSAGINAYIAQLSPRNYPIEYKLLDYAPEKWSPLKCALLLKLMTYDLTGRSDDLRMTNILNKFGPAVVRDLFPNYPFREEPIVPVGTPLDFKPLDIPATPTNFKATAFSDKIIKEPVPELGSNNWAVAGSKSATGYPLLANDPHLQLNLPSIWYQVQLVGPDVNVYGASLPGAPGVIIGFNQDVSWGVTNGDADVLDWYELKFKDKTKKEYWHQNQWKPTQIVIEEIKIRGKKNLHDTVYYSHHGPVVYDKSEKVFNKQTPVGHALRWIAHEKSNELHAVYLLNRARNYQDYTQALSVWVAPAQNFVYADRHQQIAIWPNGKYPLRWPEQGKFILDGTDPAYDWQAWIPAAHNPHVKNPERGFVSSANQSSAGPNYPYYLNWEYSPPERAIRINQRLAAMTNVTQDSMRMLQNDNFNVHAQTILPLLLNQIRPSDLNKNQRNAFETVSKWQYQNNPQEVGPTIFDIWWQFLSKAIWEDELGSSQSQELRFPNLDRTRHLLLQEPQARWLDNINTPEQETLPILVNQAFKQTVDSLQKQHGNLGKSWQWANHKSTSIRHLANLTGFGRNNIAIGGGRGIVNATSERHGPSWRMVVALGPQVKGYGIYPGGQSGNPGSFYYDNLIKTWRQGKLNQLVYLQNLNDKSDNIITTLQLKGK